MSQHALDGAGIGARAPSLAALLFEATARLAAAGVAEPRRDARVLLAAALGLDAGALLARAETVVAPAPAARFQSMVARRARREPVARILGRRGFWAHDFELSPAVLDPRPDSETLISQVLERIDDRAAGHRVLDLGTGSGCLLLTLLGELPAAIGLGIDLSPAALDVARANAARLGMADRAFFACGEWAAAAAPGWSVILANPPYLARHELDDLEPEVAQWDPRFALDGGADGLDAYRALLPGLARLLAPAGLLALEIGAAQARAVQQLMGEHGLAPAEVLQDLGARERCLLFEAPGIAPNGKKTVGISRP